MAGSVVTVVRAGAQVAIPLVSFAVGLSAASVRPAALRKQRGLLGRSLLAVLVVVPVVTVLLAAVLRLPAEARAGLLTMAVAVGPVAALRKVGRGNGDADYALGLNLLVLLAGLLYLPLSVGLVGAIFHRDVHVPLRAVLRPVLLVQLVPLMAGLGLAWLAPRAAARLTKPASTAGNVLLGAIVLIVFALVWRPMLHLGSGSLFAVAATAALAIAAAHALGGPSPRSRMVLASFCAVRFPAMGIVVATATPLGKRVLPVLAAYVLVSSASLVVYGLMRRAVKPAVATSSRRAATAGA
jgi:BASS family bile acid:Na+ symporter